MNIFVRLIAMSHPLKSSPLTGKIDLSLFSMSDQEKFERMRFALEGTQLGIWDWDLKRDTHHFDRRWLEMLGLELESSQQGDKVWMERVHPEDLSKALSDMQRYLDGHTPFYENIHRMRHVDGRWIYILDRGRISSRDSAGAPIRFTGTHLDVTITEEARRVVEARENLFRTIVEGLPASVAMLDRELRYLAYSQAWLTQYGLQGQSLFGRTHYEIFPEIPERWKEAHRQALAGAVLKSDLDVFERVDGTKQYLKWSLEPWREPSGEIGGLLMMTEDLTDAVETRERLESASRLSALGEMAGGIAHEINNPLSVITGFCERVRHRIANGNATFDEIDHDMSRVLLGVERISKIVNSMRSLSRDPQNKEIRSMSLNKVLEDIRDLCWERFRSHGIEIEFIVDQEYTVWAEPTGLSQILINLLNNAHHAIIDSKQKRISVEVYASSRGDALEVHVNDSGPGVPAHIAKRIFEPFFTTKAPGQGTGLGLSLSQAIAARFGGQIRLQEAAAPGAGAHFVLKLRTGKT